MNVIQTELEGVTIIEPDVFGDHRGFFMETHNRKRYREHHIDRTFVQDNLSYSRRNILRGLHYQLPRPQAKLVQVLTGEIYDVAVDIRKGSPTFGKWVGVHLSGENHRQILVDEGFAHGFCVVSGTAQVAYKCSDYYHSEDEGGILWSDSTIGIEWPVKDPLISEKDRHFPLLADLAPQQLYNPVNPS